MRFAPIVPNNKIEMIRRGFSYHLCLAHRVLDNPEYRDFYRDLSDRDSIVIMDNSVHELGEPLADDELLYAYESVQPNIVVLPDWPYDFDTTYHYLKEESGYLKEQVDSVIEQDRSLSYMVCPHVDIAGEASDMAEGMSHMLKVGGFDYMGICKDYEMMGSGRGINGRATIVSLIADQLEHVKIHMLGIHKNPMGEVRSWRQYSDYISGFDSGIPYRITRIGRKMEEYYPYPPYPNEEEDSISTFMTRFVREELNRLSKFVESI